MAEPKVISLTIQKSYDGLKFCQSKPPDFCIKIENESLLVDKELLASSSSYFKCMFDSGMQEVQKGMVELKDLEAQSVKTVISYICGEEICVQWDDVTDYLDIVEAWQMTDLKDKLEEYIISNINTENCLDLAFVAQRYNTDKVMNKLLNFFSLFFADVAVTSNFLSLKFAELQVLFTDEVARNISCDVKLTACINWIMANEKERENHFLDLVQHVGITRCSDQFIQLCSKICMDMYVIHRKVTDVAYIRESRDRYISKVIPLAKASSRLRTAIEGQTMIAIGDTDLEDPKGRKMLNFDFKKNETENVRTLPEVLNAACPARCWTPYGIFSGGGQYDKSILCALLDIQSMNYIRLPDFNVPLSHVNAVFVNGKVYVLGKYGGSSKMYSLDLKAYHWTSCQTAEISEVSYVCGICTKLYVINRQEGTLHQYYTKCDKWIRKVKLLDDVINWNVAVTTVNKDIYFVGGTNGLCAKYSTTTREWTRLTSPLARPGPCSASYVDGKIVLCGGYQSKIEMYDISHDEWYVSSLEMPLKMFVFTMAV